MEHRRKVGFSIRRLSNEFMRFFDSCVRDGQMTGMHYGVLHFISRRAEDTFQRDVEKEFNIRRSTATGILQLMEKRGLILREGVAHDARLKRLVVTEKAQQLQREIRQQILAIERQITLGVTEEELEIFFRVLDKISQNIT